MGIIFLTNYYYQKPMANGVCVHNLAKELVLQGEQVSIICYQQSSEKTIDLIDGVNVYRIRMPFYRRMGLFYENHRDTILGKLSGKYSRLFGCILKLIHLRQYPLCDTDVVRRYVSKVDELIRNNNISTVVAVYTPIEAIKSGAILKKKYSYLNLIYYSLDTLSNEKGYGLLPEVFRSKIGFKHEKIFFSLYDRVILMNCHKAHYEQKAFSCYKNKIWFTDFPLFESHNTNLKNSRKSYKLVYTGYLNKHMRNPRVLLEFLRPFLKEYILHFYVRGDCDEIIDEYIKEYPSNIINHGFVSHEESLKAISDADVLLSIGNFDTNMVPSKIYEYISTGKPIFHVYSYDKDPCLLVFEKYGNALCVKRNEMNSAENIEKFFRELHTVSTHDIKSVFKESTPAYTVNLIKV